MNRRIFIGALVGGLIARSLGAHAQQPRRVARIGGLSPSRTGVGRDDLLQALHEFGYVDGRNAVIEYRWAEGKVERLPGLAAELVGLKVDVIVARGSEATQATRQATTGIPIVAYVTSEAVRSKRRVLGSTTYVGRSDAR